MRKIAQPTDVARAAAFLASHRAAGHISGQCISVDGGMEGRIVWSEDELAKAEKTNFGAAIASMPKSGEVFGTATEGVRIAVPEQTSMETTSTIPLSLTAASPAKQKIKILLSVDFDAVSGWLGKSSILLVIPGLPS